MPLEGLDEYDSDSGSSVQSCNSEAVPKTPQDDSDSNATEAESIGESREEKFSTGNLMIRTSTRQLKNPSGAAVRRPVLQTMMLLGHLIRKASCQNVTSCSDRSVTSADSSALAFNGSLCRHGTRIMWRQMIIKERLRELWRSLCMMQGWKSLRVCRRVRDTIPELSDFRFKTVRAFQ